MMKIYNYHPDYSYFLSEDVADPSPLEPGAWLIPAHATTVEPPTANDGEVAIFDGTSWSVIEDKRGVYYPYEFPEPEINNNPLEAPLNSTREVPPIITENQTLSWNDGWVVEDLPPQPELTPEEKLANAGLTVDDLRNLLGL